MILRASKALRPLMSTVGRLQSTRVVQRSFSAPSALRASDLVQQMYLKELSAYKVPAVKAADSEGHVSKFALPKAPATPEEADLAGGLKDYETQQPEIEGQAAAGEAAVEDWFEEPAEEEAHH